MSYKLKIYFGLLKLFLLTIQLFIFYKTFPFYSVSLKTLSLVVSGKSQDYENFHPQRCNNEISWIFLPVMFSLLTIQNCSFKLIKLIYRKSGEGGRCFMRTSSSAISKFWCKRSKWSTRGGVSLCEALCQILPTGPFLLFTKDGQWRVVKLNIPTHSLLGIKIFKFCFMITTTEQAEKFSELDWCLQ